MASTGRECLKFSQFEFSFLIKIRLCDHCNYIDHNYMVYRCTGILRSAFHWTYLENKLCLINPFNMFLSKPFVALTA